MNGTRRSGDAIRVAIIGAGAIGSAVAAKLASGAVAGVDVVGFLVRDGSSRSLPLRAYSSLDDLLADRPDVVVEAAGRDAVIEYGERCLLAGCDVIVLSCGALGEPTLSDRLVAACRDGARMLVPSGAIGGLDVLRAAAESEIDEVLVEQRKPPGVLLDDVEAAALVVEQVVFDGPVAEVVRRFPRSTNVAAAVALAGIGFDRTTARVIADPTIDANVAVVTARGAFGVLTIRLENVPSANPRTSAVVADSVIACLRRRDAAIVVPA